MDKYQVNYAPHIKTDESTPVVMSTVLLALTPPLVWACFVFGWRALAITVLTVAVCVASEALFNLVLRKPQTIGDLSAVVTGVLLAFNLPVTVPLWIPVAGGVFAIVIVKMLFGGMGKNFMNPALAARVFLFSWPRHMNNWIKPFSDIPVLRSMSQSEIDAIAQATPLKELASGDFDYDNLINLFTGNIGGCIGEISTVLLLIGGLFLMARKVITWHTPFTFIATVALFSVLFPGNNPPLQYMLAQVMSGGLMLGAFFMATDYATSPISSRGKLIFGVGCGLITVLIRFLGGYPEGVSYSILIMNAFVYVIDRKMMPRRYGTGGAAHV